MALRRIDEPPQNQDTLSFASRHIPALVVALGHLLQEWANSDGMGGIRFIRGANNCRRSTLLDNF